MNNIINKTLLHYINLEYYANELDEEFQILLSELRKRCDRAILSQKSISTKASYNVLMKIVKDEVAEFQKELKERLDEEAELTLNNELKYLDKTYNKTGGLNGKQLNLTGITVSTLLFAVIAGKDTLKQFVERTGKNILRSYDTSVRSGYLFGQDTNSVINNTQKSLEQVSRGLKSGVRTAIPSFAKTTDRIIFKKNEVEVTWVATLDGKTCITCSALSGLRFKSIVEAPTTPHLGCRCQLIPSEKITEPIPDFEEFINSLSEEDQKHVLGKERFKMWKEYGIKLNQFTNNGTVIPKEAIQIPE